MKKRLLPFVLAGALTAAFAAPASAATCEITQTGTRGGAVALASLISAAVNAANVGTINVCDVEVNVLNNSLNNLLRNADIDILNDVLNNSANNILRDANIQVLNIVGNTIQVNVLSAGVQVPVEITLTPA